MRPDDLRELIDRRPFLAFRIHLTNAVTFDVRHPDQVTFNRASALIASGEHFPRIDYKIALLHITHLEPIVPPISPTAN